MTPRAASRAWAAACVLAGAAVGGLLYGAFRLTFYAMLPHRAAMTAACASVADGAAPLVAGRPVTAASCAQYFTELAAFRDPALYQCLATAALVTFFLWVWRFRVRPLRGREARQ